MSHEDCPYREQVERWSAAMDRAQTMIPASALTVPTGFALRGPEQKSTVACGPIWLYRLFYRGPAGVSEMRPAVALDATVAEVQAKIDRYVAAMQGWKEPKP